MIDLKVELNNFEKLSLHYSRAIPDLVARGVATGIRRTLPKMKKRVVTMMRRRIKLPPGSQKKIISQFAVTRGNDIDKMFGQVRVSSSSINLIHFVKGGKRVRKQKGVKVAARKPLKTEIVRGRQNAQKGAFIAKGKNGNLQVFRRMGNTKSYGRGVDRTNKAVRKVAGPNPAKLVDARFRFKTVSAGMRVLQKEYHKAMEFLLDRHRKV